jgi:site-specific DNA-adenine methylase
MNNKPIKSFFARTGGKHFSKNKILPYIKDLKYNTYVEPFCGAGSIFFGRDKKVKTEILNDYDILVYNLFNGMKYCGNELNDYKNYFMSRSIFKWYLLKEKQDRRLRMKTLLKGNPKYLKEIYCHNKDIEKFKEELFIIKNGRFSDTLNSNNKPNKKIVEMCRCIKKNDTSNSDSHEVKVEYLNDIEEDNDIIININKNDLTLIKKKYYIRNNKYHGDDTKWRIHNPKSCGWIDIFKNCNKYHERLKDVKIFNEDYIQMLKYDSKDTLFYFDPPWTLDSQGNKGNKCYNGFVELKDFYNSIKDLKGYIMISYNNNKNILETFKHWRIEYINTLYTQKKGNKNVQDLLIFNFDKDFNKIDFI